MKKSLMLSFLSLITISTLNAGTDIDEKINNIKNAPQEERANLMNEFKKELIKMSREERINAIAIMKEKIGNDIGRNNKEQNIEMNMKHNREVRIQENEKMNQMQNRMMKMNKIQNSNQMVKQQKNGY